MTITKRVDRSGSHSLLLVARRWKGVPIETTGAVNSYAWWLLAACVSHVVAVGSVCFVCGLVCLVCFL